MISKNLDFGIENDINTNHRKCTSSIHSPQPQVLSYTQYSKLVYTENLLLLIPYFTVHLFMFPILFTYIHLFLNFFPFVSFRSLLSLGIQILASNLFVGRSKCYKSVFSWYILSKAYSFPFRDNQSFSIDYFLQSLASLLYEIYFNLLLWCTLYSYLLNYFNFIKSGQIESAQRLFT